MSERGKIIVLEGAYSSGKSTQARMLHQVMCDRLYALRDPSARPLIVREPGGTALGERVRTLVLDDVADRGSRSSLMLFCAARAQLLDEVVRPAVGAGCDVVMDRYWLSSVVYQGVLGGCGQMSAAQACRIAGAHGDDIGDLLIYLDVSEKEQETRTSVRPDGHRFHKYGAAQVVRAYESALASIARLSPEYETGKMAIRRVDASGTPEEVHQRVLAVYDQWRRTV